MKLTSLHIDAEGCDLEFILTVLHCRKWYVTDLYLRGDVWNVGTLMLYVPEVDSNITIINTNDVPEFSFSGIVQCIQYMLNSTANIQLYNILKYCCDPPQECKLSEWFVETLSTYYVSTYSEFISYTTKTPTWTIDRLTASMIESLVFCSITVYCGIFQSEIERVKTLQEKFSGKIEITSVL